MKGLRMQGLFRNLFRDKKKEEINISNKEAQAPYYKRRFYNTWTSNEIELLDDAIFNVTFANPSINLTEIQKSMPKRSISSIRCKTRERCAELGIVYSTYTQNNNNGKDKIAWNRI